LYFFKVLGLKILTPMGNDGQTFLWLINAAAMKRRHRRQSRGVFPWSYSWQQQLATFLCMPRAQINFPIDGGSVVDGGIVTPNALQTSFTVALNLSPICVQ